ncbi:MAG TPA: trypsin-like peptidase domain-containing protein [Rudaea sp.]|jgi:serine peptidase DegS|uniref:S1C family serine protease n=1 Tax=Rudaea sp. TaxID=2136325 RepID=UPI002F91D63C
MKNLFRFLQFVAQFVTLGLALAFVVTLLAPQWVARLRGAYPPPANTGTLIQPTFGPAGTAASAAAQEEESPAPVAARPDESPTITRERARAADTIMASYSRAVQRAAPSVVSITADKVTSEQRYIVPTDPRWLTVFPPRPFGAPVQRAIHSLGSGVIVDSKGYVLTNNHVINGAEQIMAVLSDGRTVSVKLVGSDPETDLAVLKLDTSNLPPLPVSDQVPAVGDVVLAIGSPFGLGNTVTMGIISALGRQVTPTSYEDSIQTDAAINEGNSGGALVNAFGELVGINSRNYSPSEGGGNVGIGFAIPVSTAKRVLEQIINHGHVVRGWMGASYESLPPQHGNTESALPRGVAISALVADGPAARAGLKPGDVLTQFGGEPIVNQFDLYNRESRFAPDSKVEVDALRDGKPIKLDVVLAEKPPPQNAPASGE